MGNQLESVPKVRPQKTTTLKHSIQSILLTQLKSSDDQWIEDSALENLVRLHRQAGNFARSLNSARQLDTTLAAFDDRIGVGLGRMAIHEVFELSRSHPQTDDAREAFSLADGWFHRSGDLAFNWMEAGAKGAQRCGLIDKAQEYEHMADIEQKRIDEMINQRPSAHLLSAQLY